jgi:hypothetical protein
MQKLTLSREDLRLNAPLTAARAAEAISLGGRLSEAAWRQATPPAVGVAPGLHPVLRVAAGARPGVAGAIVDQPLGRFRRPPHPMER